VADSTPLSWRVARSVAFQIDAERIHRVSMWGLARASRVCRVELAPDDIARAPALRREVLGISFPNPLGLAAGFDKDAEAIPAFAALGFGFIEVGTVTAKAQPGNDKPRLFRIPADRALKNRLGFNNHGAAACARAIEAWRGAGRIRVPLGVNIGKSKVTPNDDAARDYQESFRAIADGADYVVVNVSSPNTPGLRDLQKRDELTKTLDAVCGENAKRSAQRPILVKLAPDLSIDDAHECARATHDAGAKGLVISNTTISPEGLVGAVPEGPGGISGAPLFLRSTEMLRALAKEHGDKLVFMGVGGIMDGEQAQQKLDAGASLVQAYTGFIYGGPGWPRRVLRALRPSSNALAAPAG
jgi:dihydroorotate dehydrogenase